MGTGDSSIHMNYIHSTYGRLVLDFTLGWVIFFVDYRLLVLPLGIVSPVITNVLLELFGECHG